MQQLFNGFYAYNSGRWGLTQVPRCHLRLIKTGNQHIALVTQIPFPIYTGLSVTNGYEAIVTQIVEEFHLDPKQTMFIEHWSQRKDSLGIVQTERLEIVTLTWKRELVNDPKSEQVLP